MTKLIAAAVPRSVLPEQGRADSREHLVNIRYGILSLAGLDTSSPARIGFSRRLVEWPEDAEDVPALGDQVAVVAPHGQMPALPGVVG